MALWKDVVGYEGLYLISTDGEVLSLPKEIKTRNKFGNVKVRRKVKKLKPYLRGRGKVGYPSVCLTNENGEHKAWSIHRLVATAFIPNPDNLPCINHIDENPLNCNVNNLEWCTHQYNVEYSKARKIAQYFDGEKIAEYKSIVYASKISGISRTAIGNCLAKCSYTAGGYEWKYCD